VAIAEFSTPLPLRGQRRNYTGFPNYPARNQRAGTFNAAIILEFLSLRERHIRLIVIVLRGRIKVCLPVCYRTDPAALSNLDKR
jgi:hypothetical protein